MEQDESRVIAVLNRETTRLFVIAGVMVLTSLAMFLFFGLVLQRRIVPFERLKSLEQFFLSVASGLCMIQAFGFAWAAQHIDAAVSQLKREEGDMRQLLVRLRQTEAEIRQRSAKNHRGEMFIILGLPLVELIGAGSAYCAIVSLVAIWFCWLYRQSTQRFWDRVEEMQAEFWI